MNDVLAPVGFGRDRSSYITSVEAGQRPSRRGGRGVGGAPVFPFHRPPCLLHPLLAAEAAAVAARLSSVVPYLFRRRPVRLQSGPRGVRAVSMTPALSGPTDGIQNNEEFGVHSPLSGATNERLTDDDHTMF